MSEFKGTPGPWLRSLRTVYALNERGVNRFSALIQDAHTPDYELKANAQLIAAAPELLEALLLMLHLHDLSGGTEGDVTRFARAAIAKALGEE